MPALASGAQLTVHIDSAAHGGEGVARAEGMVIFVRGGVPGDTALVELLDVKKRFARGRILEVMQAAPGRVSHRCPAAAAGAGCCDYSEVSPQLELELKAGVLRDQLERIGGFAQYPEIESIDLSPTQGWRTRFRLGVDERGRAGFRASASNDVVVGKLCAQAAPGVLDDLLAPAARFSPRSELIVAVDSAGNRTVVEAPKAARGRSVGNVSKHVDGEHVLQQQVDDVTFNLSPLSFWQAHVAAPQAYADIAAAWLAEFEFEAKQPVVWDLYGGVGLFVPAVLRAIPNAKVISVEISAQAAKIGRQALPGRKVDFVTGDVAKQIYHLTDPQVVILDPPRKGAGPDVISAIAARQPEAVLHIGCDPATFARDLAVWAQAGYTLEKLTQFNAFPGTHHSETFSLLVKA
ncbi:TRAM domain-containing protein [Corynebacterium sp. H128]|uniref:class I SAM-dependent RNA methyltransferase n=1 Tax=Corynebacterium sp. H128 TaxID=3133427 RepID=UPI0030A61726